MSSRLMVFLVLSMLIMASIPTAEAKIMAAHDSKNVCVIELAKFALQKCGDRPLSDGLIEIFEYACKNSITIEELEEMVCPE
ncbi:hypothetical protein CAEBREN_06146 [Caenorhabditis brenneri]|uniref:Uncharacterized protein n=1 Tax=Caenorhabditis brenneri TaxID=135651 RepID=G0MJC2_CAEBE|nr:hypothetical protein CAEBREN_06146 [Caenorhabditis brenneri]